MINWYIVSSSEYIAGNKNSDAMYFLNDTHEIYRGAIPFTESVVLYTDLPATGIAVNRLYINSTTLEGKVYNGTEWKTVINPVVDTVTADGTNPVSSKAVAAYVAAEMAKVSAASDVVSSLSWDSAEHLLTITKGDDSTEDIVFDGLGASLNYNSSTGNLQLLDASGNLIGNPIKLDLERFVSSGEYDPATKSIKLYFDAEKTDVLTIPVADLVDTYTAESSNSLNLSVESNVIKGSVKISTTSGNILTVDENGLYVASPDLSSKMDKQPEAVEGNIAVFNGAGQVVDSGKSFDDLASGAHVYTGASIEEAVAGHTPVNGDFCIVKTQIGTSDKYQYTAYVHNGTTWVAMDGNYSAENVFFADDLVTTSAIGNITLSNGQATIPAAGKNLKQVFDTIFVKEKNPSITQPSVSVSLPVAKSYEVGTTVTPSYTATLNAGNYQYGPATGVTATSWEISDTASHSASTNTGSFDAFVVEDDTNYKVTAKATYEDGAVPVTNTGNPYDAGKIVAGSKTGTSSAVTGYRKGFYGTLTSKDEITSDVIRGLSGKTTAAPAAGNVWNLSVPVGALRVIFAYPASVRDVSSVLDVNGLNAEIKSAFSMSQVDVEGVNNYTAIAYKVYVMDFAAANDTANTLKVTL